MEVVRGRRSLALDGTALASLVARHEEVLLDLGTGDGRFVIDLARRRPRCLVIGIDACRDQLREASRKAPANALFLCRNVLAPVEALHGAAGAVSVNFPWGSLLTGLLDEESELTREIAALMRPGARLDVRLNSSALAEVGYSLEAGAVRVAAALQAAGFIVGGCRLLDAAALRGLPSTWAKKLAYGRDPRAVHVRAAWPHATSLAGTGYAAGGMGESLVGSWHIQT